MLGFLTTRRLATLGGCLVAIASAATLAATSRPADPRDSVGVVERVQGEAHIERNGLALEAKDGQAITRRDHLKTGPGSRLLLSFNDGSRLAVGEGALLVVADFMPEAGRRSGALILDLVRGAIRLIASKPQRAPDKRVEVRTAAAIISSQGVDLWSGPVGDKLAVLVIKGRVDVRNDAGWVILDRKRLGTLVSSRVSAPEKPFVWPADRTRQSLLTVAFK